MLSKEKYGLWVVSFHKFSINFQPHPVRGLAVHISDQMWKLKISN